MAINNLTMAQNFQTLLDQQILVGATSGFMEVNAGQVKYDGGDTVKIPTLSMQGLGNYDRDEGYNRGAVSLKYQDYKLTQDRGRKFLLDSMDVNESNFLASATNVMSEFQRLHVIPEIDAYRYSKIAAYAKQENRQTDGFTANTTNILDQLSKDILKIKNVTGNTSDLVIVMNIIVKDVLENTDKFQRTINVGEFTHGGIHTAVNYFNGIPIIDVPSDRMKTAYIINDGKTIGQEEGGFKADSSAKSINWIIMSRRAPIAVSKTDKMRIFDPGQYQAADAWSIDYRKFHDIWIPKNRMAAVWANIDAQ